HDLAYVGGQLRGAGVQVEVDLGVPVAVDSRTVRRLVGAVLQVHALQGENRTVGGLWRRRDAGSFIRHFVTPVCNSLSRPPRASRSRRSSHPPTCVSPMKICGTVRRPLRDSISVRAAGMASTSISSSAAPFCSSSSRARAQYGHQLVAYITTFGTVIRLPSSLSRAAGCPSATPPLRRAG